MDTVHLPLPGSLALTVLLLCVPLLVALVAKTRTKLPPGPRGHPLFGNAFQMPTEAPWVTYTAWAKIYGEIMSVSVLGQPLIFLSSPQAVADLFERKSAIYSDRPELVFCGELVGYKHTLPLCGYGDNFREHRKLAADALGPRNASSWRAIESRKVEEFLRDLLQSPELFMDHIRLLVARIGFEISHGHTVGGHDDPMLQIAAQANRDFAQAVAPGAYLCDVLPVLRYIPAWTGVGFKKEAKIFRKTMEALRDGPYDALKAKVALGTAKPSFTTSLIQREEHPTEAQELLYKWSSVSLYTTAADTSVSAIGSLFVALSLYPEVQKKAQEELDRVIGHDRLPSFEDRPNLPYLNAIVNEIHRWNPVAPLALPHRCMQEDIYNGFRIPRGSIVFANTWGILHNETMYPSPMEFMPERYLDSPAQADPKRFAFGYGRRGCPAKDLADDSIFITAAMTLAAFNLARPPASTAQPQYTSGLICHPLPFACHIRPRSRDAENLVVLAANRE